jgi:hypothetical protein
VKLQCSLYHSSPPVPHIPNQMESLTCQYCIIIRECHISVEGQRADIIISFDRNETDVTDFAFPGLKPNCVK